MDSGHLFFSPSSNCNMLFLGKCDSVFRGARSTMNMEETSKRRFFCNSRNELFDDEYYDEQLLEKKRRLTPEQVNLLEKSFETENKLEAEHKTQLAKKLGVQPRQVAVWFQNRRARWKTKQLERDYHHLKSTYDSLLSQYDSIVKHNDKLKAEVVLLTEKLQAKEPLVAECDYSPPLDQLSVKVEDRVSTGTGGSAVVDDDGPQPVDSGNALFPNDVYRGCIGLMDTDVVHSEEDDGGSDDGSSYLSRVLVAEQQHCQEEEEPLGWWVWS